MKRYGASVRLSTILLILALLWRMVGAPLNREDLRNLQTPLWQARILLPQRLERVFGLWFSAVQTEKQTDEETGQTLAVYITQEDRLAQMTMEDYVCGVIAAEMPAQYHMEALKAQAVAARTRALWQMEKGGCDLHPEADICTDSTHCQGYATLNECRNQWGSSYEAYRNRIFQAQRETEGQWIAYDNEPITVLYHAISGGRTENAETVFADAIPYLVSVESSNEENVRGFQQETGFTFQQIADRLNAAIPPLAATAEQVQRTLTIGGYTESGRVSHVQINGERIEATVFRKALDLRSTWFSLSANDTGITFHQRGYGHGVGMSQAGANAMAASGSDHVQILQHYYTGTEIIGADG